MTLEINESPSEGGEGVSDYFQWKIDRNPWHSSVQALNDDDDVVVVFLFVGFNASFKCARKK